MAMIDTVIFILLAWSFFQRVQLNAIETNGKLLLRENSTVLKGLSAFFVIAAHTHNWLKAYFTLTSYEKLTDVVLSQLGGIGVLIFFFLSGYGIQEGYGKGTVDNKYLIKRAENVLIPYAVLKLLFLFIELFLGVTSFSNVPARLLGIATLEDWFIFVVVIEYIFYYVSKKLSSSSYSVIIVLLDAALSILFIYQGRADRFINSMWLFVFGVFVSRNQGKLLNTMTNNYFLMMALCFLLFVIFGGSFAINKGVLWADLFKPISGVGICI